MLANLIACLKHCDEIEKPYQMLNYFLQSWREKMNHHCSRISSGPARKKIHLSQLWLSLLLFSIHIKKTTQKCNPTSPFQKIPVNTVVPYFSSKIFGWCLIIWRGLLFLFPFRLYVRLLNVFSHKQAMKELVETHLTITVIIQLLKQESQLLKWKPNAG